jgi:hypothetical protein
VNSTHSADRSARSHAAHAAGAGDVVATDETDFTDALTQLHGGDVFTLVNELNRIEVRRRERERFEFTMRPAQPKFWRNYTLVSTNPLSLERAVDGLARARANDRSWANAMAWHSPRKRNQGRVAALIAFTLFAIPYALFGGYALYTNAPGVDAKTFAIGFIAIAVIASYIAWIDFFFGPVRGAAAQMAGRWVGGKVSESHGLDAGTWNVETPKRASFGRTIYANVLIGVIDLAVLFVGVFLPVAVVAISLFLIFDK